MRRRVRLTESDLHRIVKETIKRTLNESTQFERELPQIIDFLEELANRLEEGLLEVDGFVGGNRMFAVQSLRSCVNTLKKMNGNLYAT